MSDPAGSGATPPGGRPSSVRPTRRERVGAWLRRVFLAALALTAVAVLFGAAFLGWRLHDWIDSRSEPVAVAIDRPITVLEPRVASGTVPNVLGLDEATARQVMLDADIDPDSVQSTGQEYAGEAGLVIAQSPSPGSPAGDAVVLTLSIPARMPKLVGATSDAARDALSKLGASFSTATRYQPGVREGVVLATEPAVGRPLGERVRLVVAEAASSVFLTQLEAIQYDCGTDAVTLSGRRHDEAIVCQPGPDYPRVLEYLLNKRVAAFESVIGLNDRGGTDAPVTYRVYIDGRLVATKTMSFGSSEKLSVPVSGALRLRLETAVPDNAESTAVQAAWAAARLIGGRPAIDALIAESQR